MSIRDAALDARRMQGFKYFETPDGLLERLQLVEIGRDRAGNRELYVDQFATLLILYDFNPTVTTLAGVWAECGEFEKAIEYAEHARELAPDSENAKRQERVEQYRRGQPDRHNRQSRLLEAAM